MDSSPRIYLRALGVNAVEPRAVVVADTSEIPSQIFRRLFMAKAANSTWLIAAHDGQRRDRSGRCARQMSFDKQGEKKKR